MPHRFIFLFAAPVVIGLSGCTTTTTTNTARAATEQLLVSNAIDTALDKVNFTPFAGSKVYLDEKYADGVDTKYLIASVRHRVLHAGAILADKADDADVIMELRNGGIGTSSQDAYVGTPEIGIPGLITLPGVKVIERKRQLGAAKIGLVAYDARSKEILGGGGIALSQSDDSNWFIAGVGPWQTGSMKNEIQSRTSGPAAAKRQELPNTVAFEGAQRIPTEMPPTEDIRYAGFPGDEEDRGAIAPASR